MLRRSQGRVNKNKKKCKKRVDFIKARGYKDHPDAMQTQKRTEETLLRQLQIDSVNLAFRLWWHVCCKFGNILTPS